VSRPPFRRVERARGGRHYEDALYVLDYLEIGNPHDIHPRHRNNPFIQGVGTKYFTLLEATPLPAVRVDILSRVELGEYSSLRDIIPVTYNELTAVARSNLPEAIKRILQEKEQIFVEFFNIAEPINIRLHSLRLLPEVGSKALETILEERRKAKFASFNDVKERTKIDPVKVLVNRIITELMGGEKYYLFIRPREKTGIYLGYLEKLYGELI
jgi:putative nucleotide binding protein